MKKKYAFVNHFLPDSSQGSVLQHRKSSILIYTHLFLLFSLILLLVLSKTIAKVATEGVGTTFYFTIPKAEVLETTPLANLAKTN